MEKQHNAAKMAAFPVRTGNAVEELNAKIADFLAGRYGNLTTEEIEEFREAQADPDGSKWEREHAGEAFFIDPLALNGFLLVEFPSERMSLGECMAALRRIFRSKTISADRLWWLARHGQHIIAREVRHG